MVIFQDEESSKPGSSLGQTSGEFMFYRFSIDSIDIDFFLFSKSMFICNVTYACHLLKHVLLIKKIFLVFFFSIIIAYFDCETKIIL